METTLHPELKLLLDFYSEQRSKPPEVFSHTPRVISSPSFFSISRLQEHLNNPLLPPNFIALVTRGQFVPLEPACLRKALQGRELFFMDKEYLNEHLSRGAALVLEGLDILEPSINAFAATLDATLPCAFSNCVAFFSQRGNEAYKGHCDFDDVLVIHLEGEKRWRLFDRQPRRRVNLGSLTGEQMGRQVSEVLMRPGDALYVRAGVPHVCETTAACSLHVSFDLVDRTPTITQITEEGVTRYDHACAEEYAPAAKVIEKYTALLNSEQFQNDVVVATAKLKNDAIGLRQRMPNPSTIRALDKFAR